MNIEGLTFEENQLAERLLGVIMEKRVRNRLRSEYMDGKHVLSKLPPTAPPYLRQVRAVLGWPAKAVEMLARRIRVEDIGLPEGVNNDLEWVLEENDFLASTGQAHISALVHSTVFQVVTRGGKGEPGAVISHVSALNGTGDWNERTKRLVNFLAVSEDAEPSRLGKNQIQSQVWGFNRDGAFTLFHDYQVITVAGGRVVSRAPSLVRVPVVQLPYKPRLDRPFGMSRISRAVMTLTDAGVRTLLRSEGTADFYGAPWFMIFGPDESAFDKGAWQIIMDRVNAIPDNEDAANPRADVKQFAQASQQPHVDQLQVLAGLFAGETNIPVSSLGIGLTQANPASAEAYIASREDLIAEAEDAKVRWTRAHKLTALWAWQIATLSPEIPTELTRLGVQWADARYTSASAKADAVSKMVAAFPWMAESDAIVDSLGFDPALAERLKSDRRRASGVLVLNRLGGEGGDEAGVGGVSA